MLPDTTYTEGAGPQTPPPNSQSEGPNILLLVCLLFVAVIISGVLYVFVLSITKSPAKQAATPATSQAPTVEQTVATPTPYENPFASSSAYANPFSESKTDTTQPYQNPFDTLR